MTLSTDPKISKRIYRHCENCNSTFPTYKSELNRGRGQFCSKPCAGPFNHHPKTHKICKNCNQPFDTFTNTEYCCIACEKVHNCEEP